MRDAFVSQLSLLAERDPSVLLVTGDLGFGVLSEFARRFPNQYLNAGVAEQNMTGIAAGLALEGRRVFTYSIANFPTLRCLEQIRNDVCFHELPVTIVAVGGGFAYGPLGFSHHATEDVAVMSALPGMRVMAPNDPAEARACTDFAGRAKGPSYLRLGRNGERRLHAAELVSMSEGRMLLLSKSRQCEVAVIGGCGATDLASEVFESLERSGIETSLWSSPFIYPFDREVVEELSRSAALVVSVEEHSVFGGLGSRCAEVIASARSGRARHLAFGIPPRPMHAVGDQRYLRAAAGLDPGRIHDIVLAQASPGDRGACRGIRR